MWLNQDDELFNLATGASISVQPMPSKGKNFCLLWQDNGRENQRVLLVESKTTIEKAYSEMAVRLEAHQGTI